ncbi:MAG: hypothetical protein LBR11_04080 [Deltaproteobacteria bacterium]|nr:hypothetical protein [Deltaproteobacteria bacterium]
MSSQLPAGFGYIRVRGPVDYYRVIFVARGSPKELNRRQALSLKWSSGSGVKENEIKFGFEASETPAQSQSLPRVVVDAFQDDVSDGQAATFSQWKGGHDFFEVSYEVLAVNCNNYVYQDYNFGVANGLM